MLNCELSSLKIKEVIFKGIVKHLGKCVCAFFCKSERKQQINLMRVQYRVEVRTWLA